MYINIIDKVTIEIRGKESPLQRYIENEYGEHICASEYSHTEPDIVIDVIDDISSREETVHIRGPVSYDSQGVYLQHRLPNEEPEYNACRIDFSTVGEDTCYATFDSGFNPRFFGIIVDYLVHFAMLKYDAAYCHSCGFKYNGTTVICPAWRQVGKTSLLLSFINDKVEYIADDWSIVTKSGEVHRLPKRLNILYYNFQEYPKLLEKTPEDFRSLVRFVNQVKSGRYDLNQDVIQTLSKEARMRINPRDLFDSISQNKSIVDYIFCLQKTPSNEKVGDSKLIEPEDFAHRKRAILKFELSYFYNAYQVHKARTGRSNQFIESSGEKIYDIYQDASEGAEIYELATSLQGDSSKLNKKIKQIIDG